MKIPSPLPLKKPRNRPFPFEERYTLLDELLKSNDYQTVERNCTISLDASDKDGETSWEIRRTILEDDLVGGLMNDLTDPDILSPEDTILVYLNTLKI